MLTARSGWMITLALCATFGTGGVAAEGTGLRAQAGETVWPRWQARITSNSSFSLWRHAALEGGASRPPTSLTLLGDYYFSRATLGPQRGLRATSGVIIGPLSSQALGAFEGDARPLQTGSLPYSAVDARPLTTQLDGAPYVGIGYTSITTRSGWGFSADIGLAARAGSSAGFGRALSGQSLDDTLRELRLTPLVNVGVSYSF